MSLRTVICSCAFLGCLCLLLDGRTNKIRADEVDKVCDPNTTKSCPCIDLAEGGFNYCCPTKSNFPIFVCVGATGKTCVTSTEFCSGSYWRDSQCKDPCTKTGFDYNWPCGSGEASCVAPKQ